MKALPSKLIGIVGLVVATTAALRSAAVSNQQTAAQPPVTFSVDVSLVEVDAVVTDSDGRVIRDLGRSDFRVFEDGKPQTIDRLSLVEIPIERAETGSPAAPPSSSDVRSNLHRFEGRLYVLLLDDVHTSALRSTRVKAAARAFVEQTLRHGDLAAVVHVSRTSDDQDFTADRRRLLAAIDRFSGRMAGSETLTRLEDYNRQLLATGRIPAQAADEEQGSRALDARRVFDTIARVAERLAPVRGRRKALVWFGEGIEFDMFDVLRRPEASTVLESSRAAVAAASRANVAIYGVDARGLRGLGEETMQMTSPAEDPTRGLGPSGLDQELLRSQENLRRVSNDTGGFAIVNTADLPRAFERIVEENSTYYLLGYYSTNTKRDGTFRRIEVRVDRPGASVRARAGYVAPREKSDSARTAAEARLPQALSDALISPVAQSALPMAAHVAAFRGRGSKGSVLVTVEYGASAFQMAGGSPHDRAETPPDSLLVAAVAVDPSGRVEATDESTIALNVRPETRRAMQTLGFRTESRLELAPGRYQIRVAALVGATGLVGSVNEDVDVPDFSKAPLEMSGLVLTSVVAGLTPTAHVDERMRQVLPAPPTTMRDFRNDEAIALFAEVYEKGAVPTRDVTVKSQIVGSGGEVVFERTDVRAVDELKKSKGGYSLQISLRQLTPGDYLLRLDAEQRGAESQPVSREVSFHVWNVSTTTAAPGSSSGATAPSTALPIVPVAKGAISGVAELRQVVARNSAEWRALWGTGSVSHGRPAPSVTFDTTMIVAVFLGPRPTAGYEPEIVRVVREADALVVEWRERVPPDAGNPPNETTPFVVAGVPQHSGEVRFRKVTD